MAAGIRKGAARMTRMTENHQQRQENEEKPK